MTWQKNRKNGRRGGWENLGPAIAMMAAQSGKWNFDFDDFGGQTGRTRRKRRGRMFGSGELRLALLALIDDEPRHGYELIRAIEDMTGGGYAPSPGAVYPTLQMLEEEGLIKPAKSKSGKSDDDSTGKKPFKVTKAGKAELADRSDEVDELMGRLGEHGERAEKVQQKSPDLFRAMGNLGTVLKNRARAGKLDKEALEKIIDIIDEVAKRIERL